MSDIGPKEIASLCRMIPPAAGDYQRILDNLVKVESTFSFLQENGQSFRLENQVCMKILHQALPEDEVLKYLDKLMALGDTLKVAAIAAGECTANQ